MFKAVFRPNELITLGEKIFIESPTSYPDLAHLARVEEPVEELSEVDEYSGPTADDLRREAEMFKAHWEEEKEKMIADAKAEADRIIQEAKGTGLKDVQKKTDEGEIIKQQAEEEAQRIIAEANVKAKELEKEVRETLANEQKEAQIKGREEGLEKGYEEGRAEVQRLIERTQVMLERAQEKRGEIIAESEQEIVDLVLLIARKVIKVISENQRGVIISNVTQALRKIKSKGDVIIRLNLNDLQLATEHKQDFIKLVEGVKSITLIEDGTVDRGGCIIETDFGEIDARISSQLAELESKILEISPIKTPQLNTIADRTPNLAAALAASSALEKEEQREEQKDVHEDEMSTKANAALAASAAIAALAADVMPSKANAALTASAAMAALASLGTKGKRKTDPDLIITPPRGPRKDN